MSRPGDATGARCLAVGPAAARTLRAQQRPVGTATLDATPVECGVLLAEPPRFDPQAPADARKVLVRVRAASCNYRDRTRIFRAASRPETDEPCVVGSEFAGVVMAVGAAVSRCVPGERVLGDNAWPDAEPADWRRGVPSNRASCEYLVLHEAKLARIPPQMSDELAAAFSVGAQTAYAMVRKLTLTPGRHVLVTAAASNTGLFALAALRRAGARVHAVTTSAAHANALARLGAEAVYEVRRGSESWADHAELRAAAARLGGFDAAVDPFFDLHLARVLPLLAHGGRYVSCGLTDRDAVAPVAEPRPDGLRQALALALHKNLHLIGNCCGVADDLAHALDDYAAGRFAPPPLDSVFHGEVAAAAFLERTFSARARLGKVVFVHAARETEGTPA